MSAHDVFASDDLLQILLLYVPSALQVHVIIAIRAPRLRLSSVRSEQDASTRRTHVRREQRKRERDQRRVAYNNAYESAVNAPGHEQWTCAQCTSAASQYDSATLSAQLVHNMLSPHSCNQLPPPGMMNPSAFFCQRFFSQPGSHERVLRCHICNASYPPFEESSSDCESENGFMAHTCLGPPSWDGDSGCYEEW